MNKKDWLIITVIVVLFFLAATVPFIYDLRENRITLFRFIEMKLARLWLGL